MDLRANNSSGYSEQELRESAGNATNASVLEALIGAILDCTRLASTKVCMPSAWRRLLFDTGATVHVCSWLHLTAAPFWNQPFLGQPSRYPCGGRGAWVRAQAVAHASCGAPTKVRVSPLFAFLLRLRSLFGCNRTPKILIRLTSVSSYSNLLVVVRLPAAPVARLS